LDKGIEYGTIPVHSWWRVLMENKWLTIANLTKLSKTGVTKTFDANSSPP
jgi:hypothetical protein